MNPRNFDLEALNTILNPLRNAHRAIVDADKNREEQENALAAVQTEIEEIVSNGANDLDALQAATAKKKRIVRAMQAGTADKQKQFDEQVEALKLFVLELDDVEMAEAA